MDEKMVREIGQIGKKINYIGEKDTCIIDCRPGYTAKSNQYLKGKGFENMENYSNVEEVKFCYIKRIQPVKTAFNNIRDD